MSRRMRLIRTCLLLAGLACSARAESAPSAVNGAWRVAKQFGSGISTSKKTKADAKTASVDGWVGTRAVYAEGSAELGAHRCPKPGYAVDRVDAANYLRDGFHVDPRRLGITEKSIDVVTVTCAGKDWLAPGSLLIVKDKAHLLAVWDGIFLELVRQK